MDFQYKDDNESNNCGNIECENEYHLEIKIERLSLLEKETKDAQIIFIFGDLVNKLTPDEKEFDGRSQVYTIHSCPDLLAEKLLNVPIMVCVTSTDDMKILGKHLLLIGSLKDSNFFKPPGSISLDLNECFANAVNCNDFRSETIRKVFNLGEGKSATGEVTLQLCVLKDVQNSQRHRRFYTESSLENRKNLP